MSADSSSGASGGKPAPDSNGAPRRTAVSSFSGTTKRQPPTERQTAVSSLSRNLRRPDQSAVSSFSGDQPRAFGGPSSRPFAGSGEYGLAAQDHSVDPALEVGEQDRYVDPVLLGEGGMGRVMRVHDQRLRRDVAMKIVRAPTVHAEVRLAREARLTAQLDHPGIVAVFDAGRTEDGKLFYAMRLVRGRSLASVLAERTPDQPVGALVRHFLDACGTIAYAHSVGVLHRDLKPANVLVGEFGETQVADWGLARKVDEPEVLKPIPAGADAFNGNVFGTPAYMSPEQAAGRALDERSDVWALGAILYEILTGEMPHGDGESMEVLARARDNSVRPVRDVRPAAPVELAAIADRALQTDPADRYGSAKELAADLERWFDGQTVDAYDYSAWEMALRLVKTWRAPLSVAAFALLLLGGGGVAAWQSTVAERDRALAAEAAARVAQADADQAAATALVARAHSALRDDDRAAAEILAAASLKHAEPPEARGVLAAFAATQRPERLSRVEWGPCQQASVGPGGGATCVQPGRVQHLSPGGTLSEFAADVRTAVPTGDGVVVLATDFGIGRVTDGVLGPVRPGQRSWGGVRLSPDGTWLFQFGAGRTGWLSVDGPEARTSPSCPPNVAPEAGDLGPGASAALACGDGRLLISQGPATTSIPGALPVTYGVPTAVAWADDGSHVAVAGLRGGVRVFGVGGGLVADLPHTDAGVRDVALDPSVSRVAVLGAGGAVTVHDLVSGERFARLPGGPFSGLRWTAPDVLIRAGDVVDTWRFPTTPTPSALTSTSGIADFDVSPDGQTVATAHGDGTLRLRSLATGATVGELQWQQRVLKDVAFSPDGQHLVAAGLTEGEIRILDRHLNTMATVTGQRSRRVGWLAGEIVATPYAGGPLRWPWPDGEATVHGDGSLYDLEVDSSHQRAVFYDPRSGFSVLRAGVPGSTLIGDVEGARGGVLVGDDVVAVGGAWVARIGADGERWRVELGTTSLDAAVSPDERWVAVGCLDGSAVVFDAADGSIRARIRAHEERVSAVHLDGAGRLLTASWDGSLRLASLAGLEDSADELLARLEAGWGVDSATVLAGR